jgi:hypothetical protein
MKAACAKCSALETSPSPPSANPPNTNVPENPPQLPNFDADKLHQAILAYRPVGGVKLMIALIMKNTICRIRRRRRRFTDLTRLLQEWRHFTVCPTPIQHIQHP